MLGQQAEFPLLFSTIRVDLIKISPPSLNLVLPVFLGHHASSTASTHCVPSPKGSDRCSQPPPTPSVHSLPQSSSAVWGTHVPLLCPDFRPHVPAANQAHKCRKSLRLWATAQRSYTTFLSSVAHKLSCCLKPCHRLTSILRANFNTICSSFNDPSKKK